MLRVTNSQRGTTLVTSGQVANNLFTRVAGLMFRRGLPEGGGLLIIPCNSIHSHFMKFDFDALFLNRDGTVLHSIERMKPWRLSPMIVGARQVLELPAGMIAKSQTQVGDRLEIHR